MRKSLVVVASLCMAAAVATPATAAFPGGNGRIAFMNFVGDPSHIYTIASDGSDRRQLTTSDREDAYPDWTADGATLLFVRSRAPERGRHRILTIDADGSNQQVVFHARDPRKEILAPAWSPDGSHIVFCAEGRRPPALFVIDADGTNLTRISPPDALDCHPAWSPDGGSIAFATIVRTGFAIATMDPDGTNRRIIVEGGFNDTPDWSPDGSSIVFFRERGGRSDIFVVQADGSGRSRITDTPDRWEWTPTYSPNGQRIAFTRGRAAPSASPADIWTVRTDGTDETQITDTRSFDEFWLTWQPT